MGRKRKIDRFEIDGWRLKHTTRGWVADGRTSGVGNRTALSAGSETEAREALKKFSEAHRAVTKHTRALTIGDVWEMWLEDRARDGLRCDIHRANWVALGKAFAHRSPQTLTADDCRDYARARFALGRAPATVNTELTRLRDALKWAAARGHIPLCPYVWVPSPGKPRKRIVSVEEMRRLIQASAVTPHIQLFVVLALTTGARHTAILDLTWDRVDFATGTINYEDDIEIDPMSKRWRKGRATVPMNAMSRAALERAHAGAQTGHVVEYDGRRLKTVREGFRLACERVSIAGVTPHTLRHTIATWLEEQSVEMQKLARLLGHKDSRTTEQIYSHPRAGSDARLRDAVGMIDDLMEGEGGAEDKLHRQEE